MQTREAVQEHKHFDPLQKLTPGRYLMSENNSHLLLFDAGQLMFLEK